MPAVSFQTVTYVSSDHISLGMLLYAHLLTNIFVCVVSLFLSVEEGKVAAFLLATTAILCLRYSILNKEKLTEVGI